MTKFLQILLLITAFPWTEVNGKPLLEGISFQKGFEIKFKPLLRNPLSFIKEKWSPFGSFGMKHTIQKRYSDIATVDEAPPVVPLAPVVPEPRPAAPVFEHIDEVSPLGSPPLITPNQQTLTSLIPMPISSSVPVLSPIQLQIIPQVPLIVSSPTPPEPLSENVTPPLIPPPPPNVPLIGNAPVFAPPIRMEGELPPVYSYGPPPSITPELVNAPNVPITSNMPIPAPPISPEQGFPPLSSNMVVPPASGRFTDISRAEPIREYVSPIQPIPPPPAVEETVVPSIQTNTIKPVEPPKTDIVINENPLIRGSKLALYFGGIFLQLMAQFMNNARATIDQMTNPPPVFNN